MSWQTRSQSIALEHGNLLRRRSTKPSTPTSPSQSHSPQPSLQSTHKLLRPRTFLFRALISCFLLGSSAYLAVKLSNAMPDLQFGQDSIQNSTLDAILDPVVTQTHRYHWPDHWEADYNRIIRCIVDGYEPEPGYRHTNASHHPPLVKCRKNRTKVAILSSHHFHNVHNGFNRGEDYWARNIMEALASLGYSTILASDADVVLKIYRRIPSHVKVILPGNELDEWKNNPQFLESDINPSGVPIWKILDFIIWPIERHPLGFRWALGMHRWSSPRGAEHIFHIGYDLDFCKQIPIVPSSKRQQSIWVLGKDDSYFSEVGKSYEEHHGAWDFKTYAKIKETYGVDLRAAITEVDNSKHELPPAINNLVHNGTLLTPEEFEHEIGKAKVVLGVGSPRTSPSVYEALCAGVPFVNPILAWNHDDPDNDEFWDAQHGPLRKIRPPYVYNVKAGDEEGLMKAVDAALKTPIKRWFDEDFSKATLHKQITEMMERDWKALAESVKNGTLDS